MATLSATAPSDAPRGQSLAVLLGFLAFSLSAGLIGSFFPPGNWYQELCKPVWNPPSWLFGPVWSVLYVMIGVSGWLVWKSAGISAARRAFTVYGIQMGLNALWSALFFGLRMPGLAFAEIVLLWLAILATIRLFAAHDRRAAWLLVPYLAWVTFASALNIALWRLNA